MNYPKTFSRLSRKSSTRLAVFLLALAQLALHNADALAAASEPNIPLTFKALNVGDTEADVLRTLGEAPSESKRSVLAGLEKLLLIFDIDKHRIEVTLIGGRLISKSVTTKPSTWHLPW